MNLFICESNAFLKSKRPKGQMSCWTGRSLQKVNRCCQIKWPASFHALETMPECYSNLQRASFKKGWSINGIKVTNRIFWNSFSSSLHYWYKRSVFIGHIDICKFSLLMMIIKAKITISNCSGLPVRNGTNHSCQIGRMSLR